MGKACLPKLPFFKGEDGENVVMSLYKLEMNFDIYGVKATQKVTVASNHMSGEVDTFFYYLVMKNNGTSPSWSEFKRLSLWQSLEKQK